MACKNKDIFEKRLFGNDPLLMILIFKHVIIFKILKHVITKENMPTSSFESKRNCEFGLCQVANQFIC